MVSNRVVEVEGAALERGIYAASAGVYPESWKDFNALVHSKVGAT